MAQVNTEASHKSLDSWQQGAATQQTETEKGGGSRHRGHTKTKTRTMKRALKRFGQTRWQESRTTDWWEKYLMGLQQTML
jgi:hypothetical protein